jgi:glycosyltransferase involved in cell wall biosynthesis
MLTKTDNIKISVALCTFNGEKYIQKQLDSILNQSVLPDEIVICDDCSIDATFQLITNFAKSSTVDVKIFKNAQTLGFVKNFEKAISLCTGDIIFLSDQDDVWMPNKVEKVCSFFEENSYMNVVFTNAQLIDDNDMSFTHKTLFDAVNFTGKTQKLFNEGFGLELLNLENRITGATMAFRQNFVSKIIPFPECNGIVHDELIAISGISNQCIGFIDECLIKYRIHSLQHSGLGEWLDKPPHAQVFKPYPVKKKYLNCRGIFVLDGLKHINFMDKRDLIFKSNWGLLLILSSIITYFKLYSKHAFLVMMYDILFYTRYNLKK